MKLNKAIEILNEYLHYDTIVDADAFVQALRLLIGAGERLDKERRQGPFIYWGLLPGETKGGQNETHGSY